LHEVWFAGQSGEVGTWLQHLYEVILCPSTQKTHHRAHAQEQLHRGDQPRGLEGYQQQGRVLPMSWIVFDRVDELNRQIRELELQVRVEKLERTLGEAIRHIGMLQGSDANKNEDVQWMQSVLEETKR